MVAKVYPQQAEIAPTAESGTFQRNLCFMPDQELTVVRGLGSFDAEARSTLPASMEIAMLRDGRLRLREAIHVEICMRDGQVIVESEALGEFGSGETLSDAIEDFQLSVAELYLTLEADRAALGADLMQLRCELQRLIEHHFIDS